MSYIYIIENKDWNYESKYKYGYTKNPINRILNSHEQHSYVSSYVKLYEIEETEKYEINYKEYDKIISIIGRNNEFIEYIKNNNNIKLNYLESIKNYLVNNGGSTEFIYKSGLETFQHILLYEFPLVGLNVTEIDIKDINMEIKKKLNEIKLKQNEICENIIKKRENKLRDYQEDIVLNGMKILNEYNKFYLELATGAGKSIIVYNILNKIKPKIIIIFSPLKVIKQQNISDKYIKILNQKYTIYNNQLPNKNINDYSLISCCSQSYKNIYNYIIQYNIKDICIWFDESHWAFEEWSNYIDDNIKQFFLEDNIYISKRIFTSASPNKEIIIKNKKIFGELYNPIKVSELIKHNWLCSINAYIFSINAEDPNILYYNLEGFKEKKKKYGFSFHTNCNNAFKLFYQHYKLLKQKQTNIKPFLLLGEKYKIPHEIILDYKYDDVTTFENNMNSISYVVKRFSIGYDFNGIDIIFMSDPKTSYKDIKQTIGRGTRSDGLDINGKNLSKELDIYIPVYIEEEKTNNYKDIIEVLRYLVMDVELKYEDIIKNKIENKDKKDGDKKEENYIGTEELHGIIYNIVKNEISWNCKTLTEHLCKNNIHTLKDYKEYYENNKILNLPEVLYKTFPEFIWINTYKKDECPYYSKKECIEILKKIKNEDINIYKYDGDEIIEYLNNYDNKIPLECLWRFYGGNKSDYY
jgi:superfamily II DNA or RNA helicase